MNKQPFHVFPANHVNFLLSSQQVFYFGAFNFISGHQNSTLTPPTTSTLSLNSVNSLITAHQTTLFSIHLVKTHIELPLLPALVTKSSIFLLTSPEIQNSSIRITELLFVLLTVIKLSCSYYNYHLYQSSSQATKPWIETLNKIIFFYSDYIFLSTKPLHHIGAFSPALPQAYAKSSAFSSFLPLSLHSSKWLFLLFLTGSL